MKRRDLLVVVGVAVLVGLIVSTARPAVDTLSGLSLDTLFWLRYTVFGPRHDPVTSPAVVIALDEETWRSKEFHDNPEVLWPAKFLPPVINSVLASGAKVIGFDIIWPTSVESIAPGLERDYLRALNAGARQGKIVLSKVEHQLLPIAPSAAQSVAVQNQKNIRSVNLTPEPDDVIRHVPVAVRNENVDGSTRLDPSLSVELALRGADEPAQMGSNAALTFGDYSVPESGGKKPEEKSFLVNFDGGYDIPTYPLVDLYDCAQKGDEASAAYFREHFAGRVVLVGHIQDVEDRKVMAKRFITGGELFSRMPRCATTPNTDFIRTDLRRYDIPGVYVHAAAINSLLRHEVLHELKPRQRWLPAVVLALAAGIAAMALGPVPAVLTLIGIELGWTVFATVALQLNSSLPFIEVLIAAALTVALLYGYRFFISDRDKRMLRSNFALYLAPSVVDQLIESDRPPKLGGEQRTVSIFFSDLANFTTLSEGLTPTELVAIINNYFSAMTDIVEAHGGYVDKYIGDAIVAVFGAPLPEPNHARHAVEAALVCCKRLDELNEDGQSFLGRRLGMRIGINTGDSLVGNIGSRKRFNYTVMGDSVNVASRLQDLNKRYGTTILAAESTVAAIGDALAFHRIDRVNVKGRGQPVEIFTPADGPPQRVPAAADSALASP